MANEYICSTQSLEKHKPMSNMDLPYDATIPLLDIYLGEMKTYVHIKACTQMFRAALT